MVKTPHPTFSFLHPFSPQLSNTTLGPKEDGEIPKPSWGTYLSQVGVGIGRQSSGPWLHLPPTLPLDTTGVLLASPIKKIYQKDQQDRWERAAQQIRDETLLMKMSAIDKIAFVTSGLTKYPVRTAVWEKICCFFAISQFMEWNSSWAASAYCRDIEVREAKSDFIYQTCLSRKLYGSLHLNANHVWFNIFKYQWNVLSNNSRLLIHMCMKFLIN